MMRIEIDLSYESTLENDACVVLSPIFEMTVIREGKKDVILEGELNELESIHSDKLTDIENEKLMEWAKSNYSNLKRTLMRDYQELFRTDGSISDWAEIELYDEIYEEDDGGTNPEIPEGYGQVCVICGMYMGKDSDITDFEKMIKETFDIEAKYLCMVHTYPDRDSSGSKVDGTGSRCDTFFTIKDSDVAKFAVPRLQYGIRWLEDVLNNNPSIYPARISKLRKW